MRNAQIGFADALRRIFPTELASFQFRGWISQETLCDRSSVTFDLRQCAPANIVDAGQTGRWLLYYCEVIGSSGFYDGISCWAVRVHK